VPTMEGLVLNEEQTSALAFCHMVTSQTSWYYFCRHTTCRFFLPWRRTGQTAARTLVAVSAVMAWAMPTDTRTRKRAHARAHTYTHAGSTAGPAWGNQHQAAPGNIHSHTSHNDSCVKLSRCLQPPKATPANNNICISNNAGGTLHNYIEDSWQTRQRCTSNMLLLHLKYQHCQPHLLSEGIRSQR